MIILINISKNTVANKNRTLIQFDVYMWIYIIYFYLAILKIDIFGFQTIICTPLCLTAVQFK